MATGTLHPFLKENLPPARSISFERQNDFSLDAGSQLLDAFLFRQEAFEEVTHLERRMTNRFLNQQVTERLRGPLNLSCERESAVHGSEQPLQNLLALHGRA